MARDYYDVLGVSRQASKQEIKRAFRVLARKYHPDVSDEPDAEERFKEINEAYEVLSDDQKRARYDRFGHAGVNGGGGFGGAGGFGGFEEIFEELFNFGGRRSGGRRQQSRRGADRRVTVKIAFEEAISGVDLDVEIDRLEVCDICEGSRAEPGTSTSRCPQCQGTGEVQQVQQTLLGQMVHVTTCPTCQGRGEVVDKPCHNCHAAGRVRERVNVPVHIPAGVSDGIQIQVRGEGDAGEAGAPRGDLYVIVKVKEHEFFKRRNDDIILDINVNVAQAALGDRIIIPTVDGDVELTLPAGTQTGKVFRLRGKGAPRLRRDGSSAGRGDQLVYVQVEVPTDLTEEQRELFEALAETLGSEVQPQTNGRGFFDRVRDFFEGDQ